MDKYLVTGATGLIGSALVKSLIQKNNNYTIICPVRDYKKALKVFHNYDIANVRFIETDLCRYLKKIDDDFDYIIHCASPTSSKYFVDHPVETMNFGIETTTLILEYCKSHTIKSMVYLSSLESYGTVTDDSVEIDESFQGYVNPLEKRSSYNLAKRTCEGLCHAYCEEYDVPVKIVRLTQTISPDIQEYDMRIFAQFAKKASLGDDIELHTEGNASRQYIYIDDAVSAILTVLEHGKPGMAYNAANESTYISARELAEFVQKNFNEKGKVVFNIRSDMGYAPTTKIRLSTKLLQGLGWNPKTNLFDMFDKIIRKLKTNS